VAPRHDAGQAPGVEPGVRVGARPLERVEQLKAGVRAKVEHPFNQRREGVVGVESRLGEASMGSRVPMERATLIDQLFLSLTVSIKS
jgi:hypothetical protein